MSATATKQTVRWSSSKTCPRKAVYEAQHAPARERTASAETSAQGVDDPVVTGSAPQSATGDPVRPEPEPSRPALAADIDAELEQESFPIPNAVKGRSA